MQNRTRSGTDTRSSRQREEVDRFVLKAAEDNNIPETLAKSISRQIMDQEDCDFTLEYDDTEYEISFQENVLTITGKGSHHQGSHRHGRQ